MEEQHFQISIKQRVVRNYVVIILERIVIKHQHVYLVSAIIVSNLFSHQYDTIISVHFFYHRLSQSLSNCHHLHTSAIIPRRKKKKRRKTAMKRDMTNSKKLKMNGKIRVETFMIFLKESANFLT